VDRGTPVDPLGQPQLNARRVRTTRVGAPMKTRFPKEPHHSRAADDPLTAKSRKQVTLSARKSRGSKGEPHRKDLGRHLMPPISSAGFHAFQILARLIR
jgi:hypothetical protein